MYTRPRILNSLVDGPPEEYASSLRDTVVPVARLLCSDSPRSKAGLRESVDGHQYHGCGKVER